MNQATAHPQLEEIAADWDRWSVVLCKPDCVQRDLVETVLARFAHVAAIVARRSVTVAPWQIHAHYADLLVNRDTFDLDVPGALERAFAGRLVVVALAHGPAGTPARLRALLGHFDPSIAETFTIRGDLGSDCLAAARAAGRLVENLVHTSDDAAASRDFGIWFGTAHHRLLDPDAARAAVPAQTSTSA